jgi:uncharacterized protein YuzE
MCDVCQSPDDAYSFAFAGPTLDHSVEVCRECVVAILRFMAERYDHAVQEGNAAVAAMKKMFGLNESPAGAPAVPDGVGGPGVRPGQTGEGTPHREGSPGPVTYDPDAGAAYVAVRPHDRVARTASVHPHDNVMLDYDDDGQLLGVEVLGIEGDADHQDEEFDRG